LGKSVQTGARSVAPSGRIIPASAAAIAAVSPATAQPRGHTFFGKPWK
jgi:hypothetical protein